MGAGVVEATAVGAAWGVLATGAGDGCAATGAAGTGTVFGARAASATSSSSPEFFKLRFLRLKLDLERPGAVIWMHDNWSQFFGASMWIFFPSISKQIELP